MAEIGRIVSSATSTTQIANEHGPNGNIKIKKTPAPRRPDYRKIHALPLPLVTHPLPPLVPHNPLSLLHIAYVFLRQTVWPPSSFFSPKYSGYFSHETQSVHVTDRVSILGLWNHGFFGKGTLSRSEPTWLEREKKRRGLLAVATSEENTQQRRIERQAMKLERARKEQEAIEETLRLESSKTKPKDLSVQSIADSISGTVLASELTHNITSANDSVTLNIVEPPAGSETFGNVDVVLEEDIKDEEHLQLTLEEAFFLSRVLGVLDIKNDLTGNIIPMQDLFSLFMRCRAIAPMDTFPANHMAPDNPFLISYVAYHYFRSLGWVVRPGNKFAVDYLLYLRGPVFSHAEFAVIILPSYSDQYWMGQGKEPQKAWHWIHMVNRVQSSVRKTLMICYVDIPPPLDEAALLKDDIGTLLQRYKVREFVLRRWSPNRNRG